MKKNWSIQNTGANKRIAILTSTFPYFPGEQFLENEIIYWSNTAFSEVIVLPLSAIGKPRPLPPRVQLDKSMAAEKIDVSFRLSALFKKLFAIEIVGLFKSKKLGLKTAWNALNTTAYLLQIEKNLLSWINRNGPIDVVYTFWNEAPTYAACLVKQRGLIYRVISRAHGFDVYEERRFKSYMPLKRQFVDLMDRVYVLSNEAHGYLQKQYGFKNEKLCVSRLGVPLGSIVTDPTTKNEFHLVSVSYCVPVKRIDRIIESINQFSASRPEIRIKWTHIGTGYLMSDLMEYAEKELGHCNNVQYFFKGQLANDDVKSFYFNEPVDVFINVSESEGIPVSIMEAMAAGVPAIAPDVGGISELVSDKCGYLLSRDAYIEEIVSALEYMLDASKQLKTRTAARRVIESKFNSVTNYSAFVEQVEGLVNV